jgi:hypothetical protein
VKVRGRVLLMGLMHHEKRIAQKVFEGNVTLSVKYRKLIEGVILRCRKKILDFGRA